MANNNQNDIVVSAQANTKQAEANLQKLDAQIKGMAASDPKLQQLNNSLNSLGKTAISQQQAMSGGFAVLQGNLNGVITKLGAAGLAIGALKAAWDLAEKEHQRQLSSLKDRADAIGKYYNTVKDNTTSILSNLEKLDKLAQGGYLDDAAIEQTNNLVSQLNDLWGDVGLSVDQATGKVNGLQAATQKINAELRSMALEQIKIQEQVAQSEYDAANSEYSSWFKEDGTLQSEWYGTRIAGNWTGEGYGSFRRELDNKRKTAEANLLGIQMRRRQLEGNTTQENIDAAVAAAQEAQQQSAAQQQAAAKTSSSLSAAQAKIGDTPDWRLLNLQSELALAQANGGDVEGAKAALDAYTHERDAARFRELESRVRSNVPVYQERLAAYRQGVANNVDDETLLQLATALNEVTDSIRKDMEEFNRLGARLEQPTEPIEEPITEVAKISRAMTNGTFDAFGLHGLSQNSVEQQQLDVQKKIAKNTENLNVPIVGE